MSNLFSTSCNKDNSCDGGLSPIFLILILLMCGGDNNLFGGCNNNSCGSGCGMDGILPIILLLSLCGGSLF